MKSLRALFTGKIPIVTLFFFSVTAVAISFGYKYSTTVNQPQPVAEIQETPKPAEVEEGLSKVRTLDLG